MLSKYENYNLVAEERLHMKGARMQVVSNANYVNKSRCCIFELKLRSWFKTKPHLFTLGSTEKLAL